MSMIEGLTLRLDSLTAELAALRERFEELEKAVNVATSGMNAVTAQVKNAPTPTTPTKSTGK